MSRHRRPLLRRVSDGHGPVSDRDAPANGRPIKELARAHDVNPSWLFKLLRRYRLEGPAGLEPRSRRPKSSPSRIADLYEDEIVVLRKELADAGFDAGAATIHFHLASAPWPGAVGAHHLAGAPGPGLCHPPAAEAAQELLHPFRGRSAQRVLAGRHDPCAARQRRGLRGPQHHRRPLQAVRGLPGHGRGQSPRRRPGPAQIGRDLGLSGLVPHRQRAHLHARTRFGVEGVVEQELFALGIDGQALTSLPSPDLRQGRALPPDAQEVPGRPGGHRDQEATPARHRPLRRLLQRRPSPSGHRASDPALGLRGPGEGRADRAR